jgi:hypothetical protein
MELRRSYSRISRGDKFAMVSQLRIVESKLEKSMPAIANPPFAVIRRTRDSEASRLLDCDVDCRDYPISIHRTAAIIYLNFLVTPPDARDIYRQPYRRGNTSPLRCNARNGATQFVRMPLPAT